jgi:tetratricopeptide (TPR) repeat protein
MKARTTIWIMILTASLSIGLLAQTETSRSVQQQAMSYFFRLRAGDTEAAEKAVALLEKANGVSPDDAALWSLLGRAYFLRLSTQARTAVVPEQLGATLQTATGAFERALKLNPNDSEALSGHGMALVILSSLTRDLVTWKKGSDELNRAVEMDPKSSSPRLARGFTMVNMPIEIRNNANLNPNVIEDLSHLLQAASGTNPRAVDTLHIMLGDVYFETGQTEQAKREYQAASGASSLRRDEAQSRLAALEKGTVPAAEIASIRGGLNSCTMCHGK